MRTRSSEINTIGRATQGVRLMRLKEEDKVVAVELIHSNEENNI